MEYIFKNQKGYVSILIEKIGRENFKAMYLLNFIKVKKENWKMTKNLENFMEPYFKKDSFFDKIRFYINSKL